MSLKEVIVLTASYYSKEINEALLGLYVADLNDLDELACIDAYNRWRRNPANRTFPLPAQIRELVNPEQFVSNEVQAREIAARVVGSISRFGWNNAREAEFYIGPVGWAAVQAQGGWSFLCENVGKRINPTALQAQIRDQVEGNLKYGHAAVDSKIKQLPEKGISGELVQANFRKLLGEKDDDGPEGAA